MEYEWFKAFGIVIGITLFSTHAVTHAAVILTANGTTNDNSSIQLVCNIPQDTDDYALWWKKAKDGSEEKVVTIVNNGSHCNIFVSNVPGPPPSYMECICRSRVYTCVIKGLTRDNDGDQWRCSSQKAGQTAYSNYFTIQVVVGITGVTLSQVPTVKIIADTTGTLVCKTSGGLPAAIVTWFRVTSTGDVNITSQSSSITANETTLFVVTSTLYQRPSRNDNSARIYCNASNGGTMYRSQTSTIDVLYGPDPPVCTYQGSAVTGTIKITRGSTLNINCTSTSNPPSITYRWTLPDSLTIIGSQLSVVDIQPSLSGQYILQVSNTMTPTVGASVTGTNSTTIAVDVQYPPSAPTFKIGNVTVFGTIWIIAGNTLTISCYSQSNPPPTSFSWTPGGARNSADLVLGNVQNPESNGPYTCTAENTMTTTGDKYVTAQSSSSANIEVLYPPDVPTIHIGDITGHEVLGKKLGVVFGTTITLACHSDSNPPPSYSWPNQVWTGTVQQNTTITCNVSNTMYPTLHAPVPGHNFATIKLYVLNEPEQPTYFHVINETITEITMVVTWLPKFNGGMSQTFQLQYHALSQDSLIIRTFNETNSLEPMYAMITGLLSGIEYRVELFVFNANGNSTPISNTFRTSVPNNKDDKTTAKYTGVPVAGIVGGILSACILIVIVSTVACLRRKYDVKCTLKRKEHLKEGHTTPRSDKTTGDKGAYTSIQQALAESSHRYSTPTSIPEQQIVQGHPQQKTPANDSPGTITYESLNRSTQSVEEYEMIQSSRH